MGNLYSQSYSIFLDLEAISWLLHKIFQCILVFNFAKYTQEKEKKNKN